MFCCWLVCCRYKVWNAFNTITVPARPTTYWCSIHKTPNFTTTHHMIGVSAYWKVCLLLVDVWLFFSWSTPIVYLVWCLSAERCRSAAHPPRWRLVFNWFILVRGTLPRFRYDKLMYLVWKYFLVYGCRADDPELIFEKWVGDEGRDCYAPDPAKPDFPAHYCDLIELVFFAFNLFWH